MKMNVTTKEAAHKFPVPPQANVASHAAAVAQFTKGHAVHAPSIAKAQAAKPLPCDCGKK